MAKLTLNTIGSRYGSIDALNDNSDLIETAFENTLSRDGTGPNNMESDLDMDSNDIINVANLSVASLRVNGQPVSPGSINYTGQVKETQTATSGQTVFNLSTVSYAPLTNNLSVYVDGVYQNPTTYTENNSTRITFNAGVHIGAVVDFVVLSLTDLPGTIDASNVIYTPGGSGAATTTVAAKLQQTVSVKDFGAVGDGVTDDTAAIQAALDISANVFIPAGTYKCTSSLNVTVTGQVVYGAGRDLTNLDFTSSEINGLNMNGCEYARLENFTVLGTCNADTDTNAGINVIAWARGTASNMRVSGFSRGVTWENASRGWMLGFLDMYIWNNRVVGALLHGNAHACSFRGGEVAQGKYGVVIGRLNADGSINDDASLNFGGAFSAHGTIIEGQKDYMVVIGNNQLAAQFSGCYFEGVSAVAPQAMFRIGSKFRNDGVTPATGYPKGVSIIGCMLYKGSTTPQFPAIKIEALLGGSFTGNSVASAGPVLDFIDTSKLRFSYGVNSVGNDLSGGGNYVAGTSDAVQIGNREYPVTNSATGYLKKFFGWSGSAWEETVTIPATSTRGPTFHKQPEFTGGIKLENAVALDADSMNYYRVGVFTPTVIGTSTAGTATYSLQSGQYTRIGNRVFFDLNISYSGGTGTGNIQIDGLPFTTNGSQPSAVSIGQSNLTYSDQLVARTVVNSTKIALYSMSSGAPDAAVAYDGAATMTLSGCYWV
jgi:hypothetical protein